MSDHINNAYQLTSKETSLIKKEFSTHTDWNKRIFDQLKKNIVLHLRKEQDNTCCYCKRELGFDIKDVEIEHIVPKSTFSKFAFYCKNLALSCPGCNTKKGTRNVLNKPIKNYPRSGNAFKIIHAHYDSYPQHIQIDNKSVYIALSSKGSETITICELFRLNKVEDNIKKFNAERQSVLARLTEGIRTGKPEEQDAFIKEIKRLIRNE